MSDAFSLCSRVDQSQGARWVFIAATLFSSLFGRTGTAESPTTRPQFETSGTQIGEQLPNLRVYDLKGQPQELETLWENKPVLIVTSSLTCPRSRSNYPDVAKLAADYPKAVHVAIVYVIEAHPNHDPSPYKGVEDVTPENRRDGILCRQPLTLSDRLGLAGRFAERFGDRVPIFVDAMDNAVWQQLGGGPNMAVLVRAGGVVVGRHGWFEGDAVKKMIDAFIGSAAAAPSREGRNDAEFPALTLQFKAAHLSIWDVESPFEQGNLPKAKEMLRRFPKLSVYVDKYSARGASGGKTMVQYAAEKGHRDIVELLLDSGARIDAQNEHAAAALHLAAAAGDAAMVEVLIRRGADVNLRSHTGTTALQAAVFECHPEVAAQLARVGAVGDLFTEAGLGSADAIRAMLTANRAASRSCDGESHSALDYAAGNGQVEVAKMLLAAGARIDRPEGSWEPTPLIWAVRRGQIATVDWLLSVGADPSAPIYGEGSPLHLAVKRDDARVIDSLIAHHATIEVRDQMSRTPLHIAAEMGKPNAVAALLRGGASVGAKTEAYQLPCGPPDGYPATLDTPLHLAAATADGETIKTLLGNHADPNARNAAGATSLHSAAGSDISGKTRAAAVLLLIAGGASVDAQDNLHHTPLDGLTHPDDAPVREALLSHGAHHGPVSRSNATNTPRTN